MEEIKNLLNELVDIGTLYERHQNNATKNYSDFSQVMLQDKINREHFEKEIEYRKRRIIELINLTNK
jgi:hypothetical protein